MAIGIKRIPGRPAFYADFNLSRKEENKKREDEVNALPQPIRSPLA